MHRIPSPLRQAALALSLLGAGALAPAHAAAPCDSAELRQAAERLLMKIDARWQARDAAGMAALYHPQGQFRLQPGGATADGQAGIERFFAQLFPHLAVEDDHVLSLHRVTPAGPLCALDTQALVGSGKGAAAQRFQGFYLVEPVGTELRIVAVSAARVGA